MPALNALKAFEVAGRTGSFTRAAELLNVTQSAVSRQVRQLEAQLGETLLLRHHHHLELSAAGRMTSPAGTTAGRLCVWRGLSWVGS